MENSENTELKQKIDKRKTLPHLWKKGQSGNPAGKPKGAKNKFSFVGFWQERWAKSPKEFELLATEFLKDEKLRGLIIQMIDGRPQQDVTTGGQPIPFTINIIKDEPSKPDKGQDSEIISDPVRRV